MKKEVGEGGGDAAGCMRGAGSGWMNMRGALCEEIRVWGVHDGSR